MKHIIMKNVTYDSLSFQYNIIHTQIRLANDMCRKIQIHYRIPRNLILKKVILILLKDFHYG